jgi:hypothetical protein
MGANGGAVLLPRFGPANSLARDVSSVNKARIVLRGDR